MKKLLTYGFAITIFALISCSGSKKILSTSDNTALFLPPEIEANVDMFVDIVDGEEFKFKILDSVQVDAGKHEILIRLEYQPAAGSAVVVGSLGNILLRAATNKTFTTRMSIIVERDNNYRFIVTAFDGGFDITLINETTRMEQLKHSFRLKDGKFERIY